MKRTLELRIHIARIAYISEAIGNNRGGLFCFTRKGANGGRSIISVKKYIRGEESQEKKKMLHSCGHKILRLFPEMSRNHEANNGFKTKLFVDKLMFEVVVVLLDVRTVLKIWRSSGVIGPPCIKLLTDVTNHNLFTNLNESRVRRRYDYDSNVQT